ncbi:MAG: hypothetical protein M3Q27_03070 [Actinomycetota bacterium]|nr:hypothetical protein [Actinomycetota bacterium]
MVDHLTDDRPERAAAVAALVLLHVEQCLEPGGDALPGVELEQALLLQNVLELMPEHLSDELLLAGEVVVELALAVPEAARMSSMLVALTPRSYISAAANSTIRPLVTFPRRVIGSGIA